MGKTSERLETYQTQMSIYAEQHKIILANDVLDMIEQLQEDLKDDIEKVVEELEEEKQRLRRLKNDCIALSDSEVIAIEEKAYNFAIDIVKRGGIE